MLSTYLDVLTYQTGCWLYTKFGIYCSGCGGTRMVKSILAGDLYQAFRYNPWFFVTPIPLMVILVINYKRPYRVYKVLSTYVFGSLLFMVLRNLPWFSFLAPTVVR